MQISVIIPTYKPKDYIWQCLDSLDAQTLDKRLWEVIIVLNGCSDPWETEIGQYITNHHWMNARLIQTDEAGVSNARNIGLDQAKGEYITFIDDDDYVSPTYLEALAVIATPDTIAASNTIAFSDSNAHIPYAIEKEYQRCAAKNKVPYYVAKRYFRGPCMKLIHRSIIAERRYNPRFAVSEDSLFMFEISDKMRFVAFTDPQAVYYRRIQQGGASRQLSRMQRIRNGIRVMRQYTKIYVRGRGYKFSFYLTRLLGTLHGMMVSQKKIAT